MRLSRSPSLFTTRNSISPVRSSMTAGCGGGQLDARARSEGREAYLLWEGDRLHGLLLLGLSGLALLDALRGRGRGGLLFGLALRRWYLSASRLPAGAFGVKAVVFHTVFFYLGRHREWWCRICDRQINGCPLQSRWWQREVQHACRSIHGRVEGLGRGAPAKFTSAWFLDCKPRDFVCCLVPAR